MIRLVAFLGRSVVTTEPPIGLLAELIDEEALSTSFFSSQIAEMAVNEEWLQKVSEGHMGII